MKCQCGESFSDAKKLYNRHRQQCRHFWNAVVVEMNRISMALRGSIAPLTSYEWDTYRGEGFPTRQTLITWCGSSWMDVQKRVGYGLANETPKTNATYVPAADVFMSKLIELSHEHNGLIIGGNVYDERRPTGWPLYRTMMRKCGYSADAEGWRQFVYDHSGLSIFVREDSLRKAFERRAKRQAAAVTGFDYRNPIDEQRIALEAGGFTICERTYKQTGRMMLR
jgi:hypothetical protein